MKNENTHSTIRVQELDSLRGLAAISVLLYHFTSVYPRLILHRDFYAVPKIDAGYFGVELFFMISGFVIFSSAGRAHSALNFALSRFARLFPAYWGAVALAATMEAVFYGDVSPEMMRQTVVNLTMLQTFLGVGNLDASYWTLAYEISFYALIIAAFRLLVVKGQPIEIALMCWLAVATLVRATGLQIPYRLTIAILLDYGQFFIFGVAIFVVFSHRASRLTYVIATWALLMSAFGADPHTQASGFNRYILYTLPCAALLVYAVMRRPKVLRVRPLQFLGSISYSLYLTHSTVGFAVIRKILIVGGSDVLAVGVAVIVSIAVGYILNIMVEVPGQLLLAQWFRLHPRIVPVGV